MKWRFPAEAWPATPGRKPCSPSSACRSFAPSAIRSGGTQTSSTISAVPSGRLRLAGEVDRPDRLVRAEDRFGAQDLRRQVTLVDAAELDQQDRRLGRQLFPLLRRADHVPGGGDQ